MVIYTYNHVKTTEIVLNAMLVCTYVCIIFNVKQAAKATTETDTFHEIFELSFEVSNIGCITGEGFLIAISSDDVINSDVSD